MFVRSQRIVTDQGIVDGILNIDEGRIVEILPPTARVAITVAVSYTHLDRRQRESGHDDLSAETQHYADRRRESGLCSGAFNKNGGHGGGDRTDRRTEPINAERRAAAGFNRRTRGFFLRKEEKEMIKLVRLDERLIHGQVAIKWSRHTGVDRIVVANDEAAGNKIIQQSLMTVSYTHLDVYKRQCAAWAISDASSSLATS